MLSQEQGAGTAMEPGEASMLSTWNHGVEANAAGMLALQQGGTAMDMVEAGARVGRPTQLASAWAWADCLTVTGS